MNATRCPQCNQPTITGIDNDIAGIPAILNPTPLNTLGEAWAALAGQATYTPQ